TRLTTVAGERTEHWSMAQLWKEGGCRSGNELCQAYDLCPFAQNAAWLGTPLLRERFLSFLRALEIVAGRRLSYRDLLAHMSLAIVGRAHGEWLKNLHPCQWVEERHRNRTASAITELAHHRLYVNLFPRPSSEGWKKLSAPARSEHSV